MLLPHLRHFWGCSWKRKFHLEDLKNPSVRLDTKNSDFKEQTIESLKHHKPLKSRLKSPTAKLKMASSWSIPRASEPNHARKFRWTQEGALPTNWRYLRDKAPCSASQKKTTDTVIKGAFREREVKHWNIFLWTCEHVSKMREFHKKSIENHEQMCVWWHRQIPHLESS